MKNVVLTLAMLALSAGAAFAQDVNEPTQQAMPQMSTANTLDKALLANERKINDAVAKGDKAAFLALVAPGAWSADANGFMKVADFANMLDQLKVTTWSMSDEKVSWADTNTAIVTYKWTGTGTFQGQPLNPTYASTVWTKKGDKWLAVYHQESEAAKK